MSMTERYFRDRVGQLRKCVRDPSALTKQLSKLEEY